MLKLWYTRRLQLIIFFVIFYVKPLLQKGGFTFYYTTVVFSDPRIFIFINVYFYIMHKLLVLTFFVAVSSLAIAQNTTEEKLLIKKATNFYTWYKNNYQQLEKFNLYKGKGKDNEPPYRIQWKEVEKYFAYYKKNNPTIGEAFFAWHRKDFKKIDIDFKKDSTEEIPVGFDYERIVGGQVGVEEALEYAFPKKGTWKVTIKGNTALVTYLYQALDYETDKMFEAKSETELKKENGVWKISRTIGMVEVDNFFEEEKKSSSTTI